MQTLSLPDPQAAHAPENAPEQSPDGPRPGGPRLDGTSDTRPGADAGLSPEVTTSLETVRRNSLTSLYGSEWEAAGERLDAAAKTEGLAAYERLRDTPEAYGEVTGDRSQAPRAAETLWARERVLAQARHDYADQQASGPRDETAARTEAPGRSLGVRPDPTSWVGVDGEPVRMARREDGQIELSDNASPGLRRYTGLVADSRSQTALRVFEEAAFGPTRLHLSVDQTATPQPDGALGRHEGHDRLGPVNSPSVYNRTTGVVERVPDYVRDAKGAVAYRESTITMYEGSITQAEIGQISQDYGDGSALSREDALLAVFLHEITHDTDDRSVAADQTKNKAGVDTYDVEGVAFDTTREFLAEIQGRNP